LKEKTSLTVAYQLQLGNQIFYGTMIWQFTLEPSY